MRYAANREKNIANSIIAQEKRKLAVARAFVAAQTLGNNP